MKILIVDDDEIIRNASEKIFSKYGDCTSVDNGDDAVKCFEEASNGKELLNLIVLDISMDGKSGLEVLKEIRAKEKEKGVEKKARVKIIMVTGHREAEIVKECIAEGCNDYILKPIKPETLAGKLSEFGLEPQADTSKPENGKEETKPEEGEGEAGQEDSNKSK